MKILFKNLLLILFFLILVFNSCKKECECDSVIYESNFQNNYNWTEVSREYSNECEQDTLSSTFLDNEGNISYVNTIIDCNN